MLTTIRSKTSSFVVKILFVLLIVAFGAWGIGDIFTRQDLGQPILEVGDQAYTAPEFQRDLERRMQQMQQQGINLTAEQFAALGGVDQILSQTTNRMLLGQYSDRLGLTVPQSVAIAEIQKDQNFHDQLGNFSRDRFLAILRQSQLSEAGYVALLRDDLRREQVFNSAFDGVEPPSLLIDRIFSYQQETRTAEVLTIPDASMTDIKEPDQAALDKFYKDHPDNYRQPEYRAAVVLHLKPQDFTKDITVTDDELKQEYEARQTEFSSPETRAVEQVVVQDQEIADKIMDTLKGGKTFAEAVKSVTNGDPIDLGEVTKDKLPKDIADQAFTLEANAVSEPLKSAFGLHIVHVKSITPATTKTLEDVKQQLHDEIALARAGDSMVSIVNQLDDALAGGESVEAAAKSLNLAPIKIDAVDAEGKDKSGNIVELQPKILELIQTTDSGNASQVETLQDGSYVVVQVTNVTPSEIKPFDAVKEQVKSDWFAQARRDASTAKAKELQEKLKTAGDLSALAKEIGQTLQVTSPFLRGAGDPTKGVDAGLAAALFELKIGDSTVGRSDQGAVLARLSGIIPGKPETNEAGVAAVKKQLAQSLQSDLSMQFSNALASQFKIERNDAAIQQIVAPQQ